MTGAKAEVSVVVAVHNGADHLSGSLQSLLLQRDVNLELIVVDNASTDATPGILADTAARDPRVRIVRLETAGLTAALIEGCRTATAPFIARADVGDRSHPLRLRKQLDLLNARAGAVLASCGVRYVAPTGEDLFDSADYDGAAITASLRADPAGRIRNINHHGSALMSRAAYEAVGGYRPEFWFAQDLDLWLRLAAQGSVVVVPEVLYVASIAPGSISGTNRAQQETLARIAVALRHAPGGAVANGLLERAARIRPAWRAKRKDVARGYYFVGRALQKRDEPRTAEYLANAVRHDPLHIRAWLALFMAKIRGRRG